VVRQKFAKDRLKMGKDFGGQDDIDAKIMQMASSKEGLQMAIEKYGDV
jgi:hypothetical protein